MPRTADPEPRRPQILADQRIARALRPIIAPKQLAGLERRDRECTAGDPLVAEAEAAAGDESWQQWVAEYRRGDALILNLELRLMLTGGETVDAWMTGVFVENHVDAPRVERQIAELDRGVRRTPSRTPA
jgi:hypothetical protein